MKDTRWNVGLMGMWGLLLGSVALFGCKQTANERGQGVPQATPNVAKSAAVNAPAIASVEPTSGNSVKGQLTFTSEAGRVHITGRIDNLKRNAEHGFHIHEFGDCANEGKAAGDHFTATARPHGPPSAVNTAHHTGDFGNIVADQEGVANVDVWSDVALLHPGPEFAVGRAVVVHEGKDDFTTQPAGNAGARVACGVIQPLAK